ncbi:PAAR domain-containing protein [Achromobacter sp. NPDC058515]|uniref:PAAR domain-containing protein n=1 Tax=Achromobacter sp. NPDC058515 TaxID=3346533 RepID=UPI003658D96B
MAGRPIIRIGDSTSHGGTVLQGVSLYTIDGRIASGLGHLVSCPKCEGTFPIMQGVASFTVDGIPLAVEGMQTSCGATLIASQRIAVLDPGPGGVTWAGSVTEGLANGFVGSAGTGLPLSKGLRQEACSHPDTVIAIAEYIVEEMKANPFSEQGTKIAAANSADPDAQTAEWHQLPWYAQLGGQARLLRRGSGPEVGRVCDVG